MTSQIFRRLARSLMPEKKKMKNSRILEDAADSLGRAYINNTDGSIAIVRAVLDDIVIIEKSVSGGMQRIPTQYFDILYTEIEGGRTC